MITDNEEEIKGLLKTHTRNKDYKDVKNVSKTLKNIEKTLKAGHDDIKEAHRRQKEGIQRLK